MSLRIMIAEDQTMVRQALVALLELEPDIGVVAEAASGDEALAMARKHQPDVAVLDIEMPPPRSPRKGLAVTRRNPLYPALTAPGLHRGAPVTRVTPGRVTGVMDVPKDT